MSSRPVVPCRRTPHGVKWIRTALLTSILVLATGCDRSPTESNDHGIIAGLDLLDRATGGVLVSMREDEWDGPLLLEPGQELTVDVRVLDEDEEEISLGGDHTIGTRIEEGPAEGVVTLSDHVDHVDIVAVEVGQVEVVFELLHGAHADSESPPLSISVVEVQ